MVAVRFDLFLATVERERAEVADLFAIDIQENLLRLHIVVLAHAVQGLEPGFGIQTFRNLERIGKYLHLEHPIKRVHVWFEVLVVILMAIQIPTALEFSDKERLQFEGPCLVHPVALVANLQLPIVTDGLDDGGQKLVAGRHILEEDSVFHASALVEKGVQAKGIQHPGADACAVHIFFVDDAISVVSTVANNLDPEDVGYCFNMIRERARGKVTSKFIH